MDLKQDGEELLKVHSQLHDLLIMIPDKREIIYHKDYKKGYRIGKPRFKNPKYNWPSDLLKTLHDHLQNVWNFFEKYSYWFDDTILPLIHYKERRLSKKSIIYLLEEDIWKTDEIFGDYLIEQNQDETIISYFRRDRKIKKFTLKTLEDPKIKEWICRDAVKQIKDQFEFLWTKLETEIKVCVEEKFHWQPKLIITSDYLKNQLKITKKNSKNWPEAALLSLGRIIEIWLRIALGKKEEISLRDIDILREAEICGIINKHGRRLLSKIRRHYNGVKHKIYYKIDKDLISNLIEEFSNSVII
ncbi:MAG: hypothetical protein ACTSR3_16630 [Candidatus Helarchaeota archaeon]